MATSKSVKPSSILFARSAEPTTSAPASSASRALSPSAKTATRCVAAGAVREHHRPAQLLVRVADVQTEVQVHLDRLVELRVRRVLEQADRLDRRVRLLAVDRAARLAIALPVSCHYLSTSTPIERAVPAITSIACVEVAGVQVGHLRLGDRPHLVARQPADLVAVRLRRALLEPQRLLDQDGGRRRLRDEVEAPVLVDRDLDRGDAAVLLRGLRIEGLAELHDVDAVLAERRADRRRRVGLPAGDLQLDQCQNFLRHRCPS